MSASTFPVGLAQETVDDLCRLHHVRRLALFGSAVSGNFDPATSDFDFTVEFEPMPPAEHAQHYFALLEGLSDRLRRPVDLVEWDAVRNPYFRQQVAEQRVELYAA